MLRQKQQKNGESLSHKLELAITRTAPRRQGNLTCTATVLKLRRCASYTTETVHTVEWAERLQEFIQQSCFHKTHNSKKKLKPPQANFLQPRESCFQFSEPFLCNLLLNVHLKAARKHTPWQITLLPRRVVTWHFATSAAYWPIVTLDETRSIPTPRSHLRFSKKKQSHASHWHALQPGFRRRGYKWI